MRWAGVWMISGSSAYANTNYGIANYPSHVSSWHLPASSAHWFPSWPEVRGLPLLPSVSPWWVSERRKVLKTAGLPEPLFQGHTSEIKYLRLSETTILASSITDTPLFRHIRYMMITTVPSLVITLIIFTVAGFSHDANNTQHIAEVATALNEKFHITPWLLIVPVVTGILIAKKVPSIVNAVPVHPAGCCFCFDLSAGFVGRNFRNCRFRIRFTV